ncbi:MAG TPA: hypothetical protein DIV86_03865 [Alphaproteobacteria bacterium]|nr:hypothetical protein [Alphaproteobacteria bacterium]
MSKKLLLTTAIVSSAILSACASGSQYAGNVYKADQLNQQQEAKTVKILAVLPAKIEVDNSEGKKNAQVIGGLLGTIGGAVAGNELADNHNEGILVGGVGGGAAGAAAGSLVNDKVLVDGVSISYTHKGKTLNSVQVGRKCEFTPGTAIMVTTEKKETRIQANATCPEETKGGK